MASISDDDLCSDCYHCIYHPGEDSDCTKNSPVRQTMTAMSSRVSGLNECQIIRNQHHGLHRIPQVLR